jgi:tetratricopeptide (TPR) repeat protein
MLRKLFGSPKNFPFNQANEHFRNLRFYESGSPQYINAILEIIRLCQMAIQSNKHDGDAHVLLANAYLLATCRCTYRKGYPYFLARAAAVIQATRAGSMYIKNREISDKIYRGIVEQLSTQMPDWVEGVQRLPKDMNQLQQGYYDAAISSSSLDEMTTALTNDNASAYALRMWSYREQGNLDEAIRQLQLGLIENPDNPVLHTLLGSLYGELERWDEALQEYQTVARLDPNDADIHIPLATALFNTNHLDKAISEFQIGLSINPNESDARLESDARFLFARSYYKQGRLQEALREYKIIAQTDPKQAVAHMIHFFIGESYSELGQLDEAIREFQASLSIEANEGVTHFRLGKCYEQQGHKDKAIREFKIAAELGYQDE